MFDAQRPFLFSEPQHFSGSEGANLSGTNAVLDGITGPVDFRGVNLAGVSFMNSDLSSAMFDAQHRILLSEPQHFSNDSRGQPKRHQCGARRHYRQVDFSGVNLAGVSFMNSDLSAAMFDAQHRILFSEPQHFSARRGLT